MPRLIKSAIGGLADSPSIQGRYLLPSLPFLITLFCLSIRTLSSRLVRPALLTICLSAMILGDAISSLGGWMHFYHQRVKPVSNLVECLSNIPFTPSGITKLRIEAKTSAGRLFLDKGWYPGEAATQVWCRNKGGVYLPLSNSGIYCLKFKVLPYLGKLMTSKRLDVLMDGRPIFCCELEPGWKKFETFFKVEGRQRTHYLVFDCGAGVSPLDEQESKDSRKLSVGIDFIEVELMNPQSRHLSVSALADFVNLSIPQGFSFKLADSDELHFRLTREDQKLELFSSRSASEWHSDFDQNVFFQIEHSFIDRVIGIKAN